MAIREKPITYTGTENEYICDVCGDTVVPGSTLPIYHINYEKQGMIDGDASVHTNCYLSNLGKPPRYVRQPAI